MKIIGKIEAILNEDFVIFRSNEKANLNEILKIYATIDDPKLKEIGIEKPIFYSKGEIRVAEFQENNLYLGERFRKAKKRIVKESNSNPLSQFLDPYSTYDYTPGKKEISEDVPGEWSAEFDKTQSFTIPISNVISVGDLVGRK
jgi:hypothetical protein